MSGGLLRVRAAGGEPDTLTRLQGLEGLHNQPRFLPGGRRLLFTVRGYDHWDWSRASINILDLETGERKQVLENAADARYVASGHLLFARGFSVFAVPFDLDQLETNGTEVINFTGNGFGDIVILGKYEVITPSILSPFGFAIGGGAKLPTGSFEEEKNGTRLSIDLQPGTGATDLLLWGHTMYAFPSLSLSFNANLL